MPTANKTLNGYQMSEVMLGAIVIIAAGLITIAAHEINERSVAKGYELSARFAKADGLEDGTEVRIAGVKIGSITDLVLDPNTYVVTAQLRIRDDIEIPTDSSINVMSPIITGKTYACIIPGRAKIMLRRGGELKSGAASVDMMNMVGNVALGNNKAASC